MIIRFSKMHALGNDFVVIDLVTQRLLLNKEQIKRIANRNFGIGCDQILLVEPPKHAEDDFYYRIFNQDGSEVSQCGNGARCIARFIHDNDLSDKTHILVGTKSGKLELILLDNKISVNMGKPDFTPKAAGFNAPYQAATYQITCEGLNLTASVLSIQNPHCIITTDYLDTAEVEKIGEGLNNNARFKNGVNVSFMQILSSDSIMLRTYERGVGETLSCGSAACAAVAAGRIRSLLSEKVSIKLSSGELIVQQKEKSGDIVLIGPTATTFYGKFRV